MTGNFKTLGETATSAIYGPAVQARSRPACAGSRARPAVVLALGLILAIAQLLITQHAHAIDAAGGGKCTYCVFSGGAGATAPPVPVITKSFTPTLTITGEIQAAFRSAVQCGACGARAPPADL